MIIHGLNKTTLLDYPGRLAAAVFTGNCNFRCVFCQNKSLVLNPSSQPVIPEEEFFDFLKKRKNILQGVCITGGEPTLSPDLPEFASKIKAIGLPVKLDTNGYRPDVIRQMAAEGLVDMIAMDIKNSLTGYAAICGLPDLETEKIIESASFLMNGKIPYEFRTTVVKEYFTEQTFHDIGMWLQGASAYFLQCFQDSSSVLKPGLSSPSRSELDHYRTILSNYMNSVSLRGVDETSTNDRQP